MGDNDGGGQTPRESREQVELVVEKDCDGDCKAGECLELSR